MHHDPRPASRTTGRIGGLSTAPRVDFIVSNPGHHLDTFLPVIEHLRQEPRFEPRLLSLCELRGMTSPIAAAGEVGIELVRLFPPLRRSPSVGRGGDGSPSRLRRLGHHLAWGAFLHLALQRSWRSGPDLVVVPNDVAFPYDRVCSLLRRRRVPFLLVQEGIRFAPPPGRPASRQGTGGADAVAAWGPSSKRFFVAAGVEPERIALTGCPRFDQVETLDRRPEIDRLRSTLDLGKSNLLFLSNPIDDLGYCNSSGKLRLFARFATRLGPLLADPEFRLLVKLHPRESRDDFGRTTRSMDFADRILILQDVPLYPLFEIADAAVTFGSSAGLEALLFGLPLAVLEVPGAGYLHDFVSQGAAARLPDKADIAERVRRLLEPGPANPRVQSYLADQLAVRRGAAKTVAELIRKMIPSASQAIQ